MGRKKRFPMFLGGAILSRSNLKIISPRKQYLRYCAVLCFDIFFHSVDYTKLNIAVIGGFVRPVRDTRALYTVGDTSINISKEQAIDIALENLKDYSYDMPDGSVVIDFKVSRDNIVATLVAIPVDYELRPY